MVRHNQKGSCRRCATKKLARGGWFERTIAIVANCQLIGCLDYPKSIVIALECGKDKEESAGIGNKKLQVLERITKITQMAYWNQ